MALMKEVSEALPARDRSVQGTDDARWSRWTPARAGSTDGDDLVTDDNLEESPTGNGVRSVRSTLMTARS